jgi:hypothetical protein
MGGVLTSWDKLSPALRKLIGKIVESETDRQRIAERILSARFFYHSMVDGESGALDNWSPPAKRNHPSQKLPARLRGIGRAAAGIAEFHAQPLGESRARRDVLDGRRRRLLGYFRPGGSSKQFFTDGPLFTIDDIEDGSGDDEVINALFAVRATDEPQLYVHLRTLLESDDPEKLSVSAAWLEKQTAIAIEQARRVHSLTTPPGHAGDRALEGWLDAMLTIWEKDLGFRVATSVGAPGGPHESKAKGPLIRFLMAAGLMLCIEMSPDAWRRHVRDALAIRDSKNN